ncbi:MAG: class I SAM-dependent methyltransferase [Candidatus Promineifilaceae bacterium]
MIYESAARYYDKLHTRLTEDIPYITEFAGSTEGALLELGCGSGRLLLPLAAAGSHITGVDNSAQMLALLEHKLEAGPAALRERVTIVKADIRKLSPMVVDHRFSLTLVSHNTLLHFRMAEVRSILRCAAALSAQGARLFLDLANPFRLEAQASSGEAEYEDSFVDEQSGQEIEQWSQTDLDLGKQIYDVVWLFRAKESNQLLAKINVPYHYLYPHQVDLLLSESGFRLEELRGDYTGGPFDETSDRLLVHAALVS